MGFIAAAVGGIAAAGIGAYASSSAASSASSAEGSAANSAADAQMEAAVLAANEQTATNAQNLNMFNLARGSGGNAVLPDYMGGFEKQLGTDLSNDFTSTQIPLTTFQSAVGQLQPAESGAVNTTNSIFNGGLTGTMLANNLPIQQARTTQANNSLLTAKNSSLDALHQTLNSINEQQAARGYVGDSYASRMAQFQAGQSAGSAIGQAQNGVDAAALQNATDVGNIKQYGNVTLPMQNLAMPYTMGQQNAQFAAMPQTQEIQNVNNSLQPLSFVKIGVASPFTYQTPPTPGAGAFSGAANAQLAAAQNDLSQGQSVSALGSSLGSIAQNYGTNQLLSQYMSGQSSLFGANSSGLAGSLLASNNGMLADGTVADTGAQINQSAIANETDGLGASGMTGSGLMGYN